MKIDILCNDGSPIGVTPSTIYGDQKQIGIGGAELALLTMFEHWQDFHEVTLYNDPHQAAQNQKRINEFVPEDDRDILIIFRSPNQRIKNAKGRKIWWSTDQHTVGNFSDFRREVDEVVCISPHHAEYFSMRYGINESHVIDLPVREQDYYLESHVQLKRNPKQLLYCSQPDRGLIHLARWWPEIRERIPDANLVITSGRKLWGAAYSGGETERIAFLGEPGVEFLGEVSRERLVELQLSSGALAFPCTYPELFCITVAESLYAGLWPVTSNMGAVQTTNFNEDFRIDLPVTSPEFKDHFIGLLVDAVYHSEEAERFAQVDAARSRFSLDTVSAQWEELFHGKN